MRARRGYPPHEGDCIVERDAICLHPCVKHRRAERGYHRHLELRLHACSWKKPVAYSAIVESSESESTRGILSGDGRKMIVPVGK